jgi:hypothetical protein
VTLYAGIYNSACSYTYPQEKITNRRGESRSSLNAKYRQEDKGRRQLLSTERSSSSQQQARDEYSGSQLLQTLLLGPGRLNSEGANSDIIVHRYSPKRGLSRECLTFGLGVKGLLAC